MITSCDSHSVKCQEKTQISSNDNMKATLYLALVVCLVATFYAQAQEVTCPEDSDDDEKEAIIIPHPSNCKHYFVCDHGRAIVMECPEGLHFNPDKKVCDFPASAGCKAEGY
nr:PREDICTED: peritrophin-1-like [Linepithema humile]